MSRFMIILILVVSIFWLLVPQIVYVLGWLGARLLHGHLPWRPFAWASLIILGLWWGLYLYGHYWGRFTYEVKRVEYSSRQVPQGYEGYRIVHISDFHLDGWAGHEKRLEEVVQTINGMKPDLICFTGDLVSFDYREVVPFVAVLRQLRASDGVVSILGNHDYNPYMRGLEPRQRQEFVDSLVRVQREELGWHLLLNEHMILHRGKDSLAILGVENQSCGAHQIIRRGRLHEAMEGTEGMMRILLSHDPSHWRAEVVGQTDIPLTLSGHTHAMQFRIMGFTPSRWIYPECDGRYDEGDQTLYVNIGLGGTLPMRIGATPEITEIVLKTR
ncbi:MAG: metallophosphoesterase [Bacteroidaceae bacterium]|nr:metallophosphoesterase [Bacteroidaceae bacterium]MBQ6051067.1 metallophosphoesterase [Bacteroidaceae bacterium]